MSDSQTLYDSYTQEYGYIPKTPSHLIAHAKNSGAKLKYSDARKIITKNATSTNKKVLTKRDTIKSKTPKKSNKKKSKKSSKTSKKSSKTSPKTSSKKSSASSKQSTTSKSTTSTANKNISNTRKSPKKPKKPKKPSPNQTKRVTVPPKKTQSKKHKHVHSESINLPSPVNKKPPPPKPKMSKSESVTIPEPPLFRQNALVQCKSKSVPTNGNFSAVKLPPPPPRSSRCKKPSNSAKFIPDNDEKVSTHSSESAKPFMCRINYECKTEKGKQEIYNALKLLSPNINPGTITYHFTAPNAVKYPLKLEFIELYYNENAYFKQLYFYTKAPQFEKAYFRNVKSKSFVTIGDNLSDKIRKIIGNKFKSSFGKSEAGYLFHENYLKSLDYTDDTKLMFKFHVIVPGNKENINIALYFNIMDRLSVYAKESYALMFNCHRLDVKVYPNYLELISIWPNIECLLEFLQNDKVQIIMMEFKQLMIQQTDKINRKNHFLCELYSENEINCNVMQMIHMVFDEIGYTQQLKTDIGYILHPKANSSQLN